MSNVPDTNLTSHLNETEVERENLNLPQTKDNLKMTAIQWLPIKTNPLVNS